MESPLTNFIVDDLETHNTDRARPYNMTFYRKKIAVKNIRDITPYEIDKCKRNTLVIDGDNCVSNALDFSSKFKREERKATDKRILEYNLQLHAHSGSGFDTWIILNNLPCDEHIVDVFKNGKSKSAVKIFNGYKQNNKKRTPRYLIF